MGGTDKIEALQLHEIYVVKLKLKEADDRKHLISTFICQAHDLI